MLNEDDLVCAEELLRDNDRTQGIFGIGACVTDDVGITEVNTISGGGIDSGIHALRKLERVRWGFKGNIQVRTRYFFAGGRARWPLVNAAAYSVFLLTRFFWVSDMISGRTGIRSFGNSGYIWSSIV